MTQSSDGNLHIAILCLADPEKIDLVREAIALRFVSTTVTTHVIDDFLDDFETDMDRIADEISAKPTSAPATEEGT